MRLTPLCAFPALAGLSLLAMALAATLADGFPGGVTTLNFTPSGGCNLCHSTGTVPVVTLTGPTTVGPGSTNVYTLTVTNPGTQTHAGLNVSALSGVFTTGGPSAMNTQTLNGTGGRAEITHSAPKAGVSRVTTLTFHWTAPIALT